jgi:catechol 2,3-dioxygenase-like lactoylglutathione lyase family enzyme
MIDHVGYPVSDYGRSKNFYVLALAPLGYRLMMEVTNEQSGGNGDHAGFGDSDPDFWIGTGKPQATATHVAFRAKSRAAVDAFHAAALSAGGTDNGGPGVRPHYHESYYGAFVLDPDGNNIEAVCHDPE